MSALNLRRNLEVAAMEPEIFDIGGVLDGVFGLIGMGSDGDYYEIPSQPDGCGCHAWDNSEVDTGKPYDPSGCGVNTPAPCVVATTPTTTTTTTTPSTTTTTTTTCTTTTTTTTTPCTTTTTTTPCTTTTTTTPCTTTTKCARVPAGCAY